MLRQIADTANSPLWRSMHVFVTVKGFHRRKFSRKSSELDLWNWLIHSTDQNAEYTPATDVHTVDKLVATFTALKRFTKRHQATINKGYVITIE